MVVSMRVRGMTCSSSKDEEIKITPEMIEAGVKALTNDLCEDVSFWGDRAETVAQIYRAMHTAATICKMRA